jgi:hypothetical protein
MILVEGTPEDVVENAGLECVIQGIRAVLDEAQYILICAVERHVRELLRIEDLAVDQGDVRANPRGHGGAYLAGNIAKLKGTMR